MYVYSVTTDQGFRQNCSGIPLKLTRPSAFSDQCFRIADHTSYNEDGTLFRVTIL